MNGPNIFYANAAPPRIDGITPIRPLAYGATADIWLVGLGGGTPPTPLAPTGHAAPPDAGATPRNAPRPLPTPNAVCKILKSDAADHHDAASSIRKEAELGRKFDSPYIIKVLGSGTDASGRPYVLNEFMDGGSLRDVLAGLGGLLPTDAAISIAACTARGLAALHQSVTHRDVTPENILLSRDGSVKIGDLGLALPHDGDIDDDVIEGKYAYMSPEQAWGDRPVPKSDIFALGAILYECLTGHMLYQADAPGDILALARIALFVPPSEACRAAGRTLPPPLESILTRMLDLDRAARWDGAGELADALDEFAASGALQDYDPKESVKKVLQFIPHGV